MRQIHHSEKENARALSGLYLRVTAYDDKCIFVADLFFLRKKYFSLNIYCALIVLNANNECL